MSSVLGDIIEDFYKEQLKKKEDYERTRDVEDDGGVEEKVLLPELLLDTSSNCGSGV